MNVGLENHEVERRLRIFFAVVLGCLIIILGRLWYLQIVRGEEYARLADGNRMRQLRVLPPRGIILDRNETVLVRSKPSFTVSLVPGGFPRDSREAMALLSEILQMTEEELEAAIEKGRGFPYEPVRIMRNLDPATVIAIEENRNRLPGVFIEEETVREYLYGDLASHLIGYLGIINAEELQEFGTLYRGSDLIGKTGLERTYEKELRGEVGMLTVEVNALSRPIQTVSYVEPVPGHNIVLTIDHRLQAVAQRAFEEHILTLGEAPGTQAGAVVAINPKTGEILAMASIPGYEPEALLDTSTRNQYYPKLIQDSRRPLFNRVTQALYGPGSTFKPVTAMAILEEGVYGAKQVFNATGISQYGVRDWVITNRLAPLGNITLKEALGISSNHYFADNGTKVGIDRLSEWMRAFGLGEPTGLKIYPAERAGLVPDREWKSKAFADRPVWDRDWYPSDTEQISIGQGFHQMTILQIAQIYSAIANRGEIYVPQVVREIRTPQGEVVQSFTPRLARVVEASPQSWEAVIEGLRAAVEHSRGTARNAFANFATTVAAKTGTWEVAGSVSNGVFAAFAPAEDPEIVVVVVVEQGIGGASGAAPIARAVMDCYFSLKDSAIEP
ncbi:MAG TPA: penicillin-binding protein 2 [Firmicutes bacterium]|nr:penicillin-binding protein 2 [Bacillota bacterium]